MTFRIEYAYICHTGKIRKKNEDNFWCCGDSLGIENQGLPGVRKGKAYGRDVPLLAVFDGMGGESCGETAAFLAAQSCGIYYMAADKTLEDYPREYLGRMCGEMNRSILDYSAENKIKSMGTTAALLLFTPDQAWGCNLGDSRIYYMHEGELFRISEDHVIGGGLFGKSPLTQFLGCSEEDLVLEPSVDGRNLTDGDRYLICSDGLTDMLSDIEIQQIMKQESTVEVIAEELLNQAMDKGGRDNTTIIVSRICEEPETRMEKIKYWIKRKRQK